MPEFEVPVVSIIDYGMGNLFSVKQACEYVGLKAVITTERNEIYNSAGVILPGVGAFGDAMANLKALDLINPILDFIQSGRPFMGICLGMQLLMSESEEFGKYGGLGIIPGSVIRFPIKNSVSDIEKVPQVGWNRINKPLSASGDIWDHSPLAGIRNSDFMYFVHSYYCKPEDNRVILSRTNYAGRDYCSSLFWKNIFACQFHPERSATQGLGVYKNWSYLIKGVKS